MATRNVLFPIFELWNFRNTELGKVTKFNINRFSRLGAAFKKPEGGGILPPPPRPIRVHCTARLFCKSSRFKYFCVILRQELQFTTSNICFALNKPWMASEEMSMVLSTDG